MAYAPPNLSVQLNDGEIVDEGMHPAGNIDLKVPIPNEPHTLVFHAEHPASAPLFLAGAQLR